MQWRARAVQRLIHWLTVERVPTPPPAGAGDLLALSLMPADVLLIEGCARASQIIKALEQSIWSHAALYVGTAADLERLGIACPRAPRDTPLLLEALLGQGVVLTPVSDYRHHRVRVCRARNLTPEDRTAVVRYAASWLGHAYDVRQLLDLARFILPWALLPRRWHSSLFQEAPRDARTVCAALVADAFQSVDYPVLPIVVQDTAGHDRWYKRNPRFYTPRDFDLSPFFDVVKRVPDARAYRALPWEPARCNTESDCPRPAP